MKTNNKILLGAAVYGILCGAIGASAGHEDAHGEKGQCHGVNECKGTGACAGKRDNGSEYSCKGNNECKGKGYLMMSKDDCDMKGGNFKS